MEFQTRALDGTSGAPQVKLQLLLCAAGSAQLPRAPPSGAGGGSVQLRAASVEWQTRKA